MEKKEKYLISNYQAAAQLGALAGQIQALMILEPMPDRCDFAKILYALETLSELCTDLSNGIKEMISHGQ